MTWHVAQHTVDAKQTIDGTLGVGAITAPVWLQYIEIYGGAAMFIGGMILLGLRIALTIREWRNNPKAD